MGRRRLECSLLKANLDVYKTEHRQNARPSEERSYALGQLGMVFPRIEKVRYGVVCLCACAMFLLHSRLLVYTKVVLSEIKQCRKSCINGTRCCHAAWKFLARFVFKRWSESPAKATVTLSRMDCWGANTRFCRVSKICSTLARRRSMACNRPRCKT